MSATATVTPAASTIRRRDKSQRAAGFERLREQGMELLRQTSGGTWTDHNLHDPGVTMLEALCFALTEIVFRSEFPVEDLLADANGRIAFDELSLHAPQSAFPCGATTAADFRRRLLDIVEGLDDAQLERQPPLPTASSQKSDRASPRPAAQRDPPGLYTLCLKLADALPATQQQRCSEALAAYRAERALGEDVHPQPRIVRHVICYLHADIEFFGPHEAAEVLAEVYHQAAVYIDRGTRLHSRRELLDSGLSLQELYDGPLVERGFAPQEPDPRDRQNRLYIGDLVRHVMDQVPGVREVRRFWLETDEGRHTAESLLWSDAESALCLSLPGDPAIEAEQPASHAGKVLVKMFRRTQEVRVDPQELQRRVQDLKAADRARSKRQADALREEEAAQMPRGRHRPVGPYRSVQYDFPAVYGLGPHGVPDSAGAQRMAKARQLRGYLMLFEQVIANGRSQTAHLDQLFRPQTGSRKTYWWELLNDANVPHAGELLRDSPAVLESQVLQPLDRAVTRRHHLLDHLLALHGEDLSQNAMRQYCGHLDAVEQDDLLIERKTSYLRDVVVLLRCRARGFDYSRRLWVSRDSKNYSAMARRVCLLLGFKYDHARPLTRLLRRNRMLLAEGLAQPQVLASDAAEGGEAVLVGPPSLPERNRALRLAQLAKVGVQPGQQLPDTLLRSGCAHDGYRLLPQSTGGGDAVALALRDAQDGQWRQIGSFGSRDEAIAAAVTLRDELLRQNDYCEGLHLVEHLLLRPLGEAGHGDLAPQTLDRDFFDLRITAVLPSFTVRTRQRGFRQLAEETLRINCPAHLNLQILWLDFERLSRFEDAYKRWLRLRLELCAQTGPQGPAAVTAGQVDQAAGAVIQSLQRPIHAVPPVLYDAVEEEDG